MPDTIFFPAAAIFAALLTFLAIQPYAERPPTGPVSAANRNSQDITIEGDELHRFLPGAAADLQIVGSDAGTVSLIMTRLASDTYIDPRQGPHLVLAEDLEQAFESRLIEISVDARTIGEFGAKAFEIDYLARAGEESGWNQFELTPDFKIHTLTYTTPLRGDTLGYDYVGVRPVIRDKRTTMEIRSIRIRAAGKQVYPVYEAPKPKT